MAELSGFVFLPTVHILSEWDSGCQAFVVSLSLGRSYCIDVNKGWLIVTVRNVRLWFIGILTVTANHTKRNLQEALGMTWERSTPYSVLL